MLGSPVTPPALGAGELAGSNPAISTITNVNSVSYLRRLEIFEEYLDCQKKWLKSIKI
jgi:hypothetical protein